MIVIYDIIQSFSMYNIKAEEQLSTLCHQLFRYLPTTTQLALFTVFAL